MMPTPREGSYHDRMHVGRRVLAYDWLPSTNDLANTLAEPGTAVVADVQTAGRGQYDRRWQSRPGCSLLLSVTLAPPPELNRAPILIAWAAVAVAEVIQQLTGLQVVMKWPNDLLIRQKKVCGILTEQQTATVIGIGLNLNQSASDLEQLNLPEATSLAVASGSTFDSAFVLNAVLNQLDADWTRLLSQGEAYLELHWVRRIGLLHRQVCVEQMDGSRLDGTLAALSFDGLELASGDGPAVLLLPERIRHLRPA